MQPDEGKGQSLQPTTYAELGLTERRHLEQWVLHHTELLGEDLLIVSTEYDRFDRSDKRLDILALDKNGKLVVVELKLDAQGTLADLQAIRYAAFCSLMTFPEVVALRAEYAQVGEEEARQQILDFADDEEFATLDNKPRIILAAGHFGDTELTSCVLWLRTFQVDITCVEITPYSLPGEKSLVLVPRVIIPLPEATSYVVGTEMKEAQQGSLSLSDRRFKKNSQILRYFRPLAPEQCPARASKQTWMQIPTKHNGVFFEWERYGRGHARKCFVGINFRAAREENLRLLNYLKDRQGEIDIQIGEPLTFDPNANEQKGFTAAYVSRDCEPWNDGIARWAAEKMDKFIRAVSPFVNEYYSARSK
jgi:hypothetical protein